MDRKIKFRVFDTEIGEMVDTNMHVIGEAFCCGRIEIWVNNHENEKGMLERYNDMVVMQYTGLKDRNGREIYEGDIVETSKGWVDLVKWNKKNVGFQPFSHPPSCYLERTTILGNKFQNPELLQKDE